MTIGNVHIRPLELSELRLATPLPQRFVAARPLGIEHRRSVLERNGEGVLEVRRRGVVIARAYVVRGPRSWLTACPSWERVADGGLARNDDPEGEVAWIYGFEASPAFEPGEVAALLEAVVSLLARRRGRSVAVAVEVESAALVQGVLGPVSTLPILGHFPGTAGRRDAVLMVQPGKRSTSESRTRDSVRVAAVQFPMAARATRQESFAQWAGAIADAVSRGAAIVVLPELLTTEWLTHDETSSDLHAAIRALDVHRQEYLQRFSELARLHDVAIVAGTHYVLERGQLTNVAHAFTPDGVVHAQPKLHPTPYEAETFGLVPGHGVRAIELAGVPCAILVCYDAEFPEAARAARAGGAELLLVPYNTELAAGHHRVRRGASARAVENHLYVVTAGAVGRFRHRFDEEDHYAASAAFCPSDHGFPDDGVLAELAPNVAATMMVDLDLGLLRRTLRTGAVRPWLDRKR